MGHSNSQRQLNTVEDHPNTVYKAPSHLLPTPKEALSNPMLEPLSIHTLYLPDFVSFHATIQLHLSCRKSTEEISQTLTLDFPSASIKSSTYVTSPTTNQIPDDTYTKGEKPRKQWEFRTINNRVWSLCLIRKPRNTPCSLDHKTGQLQVCSKVLKQLNMFLIFLHFKSQLFPQYQFPWSLVPTHYLRQSKSMGKSARTSFLHFT